jgi:hypothetical protein
MPLQATWLSNLSRLRTHFEEYATTEESATNTSLTPTEPTLSAEQLYHLFEFIRSPKSASSACASSPNSRSGVDDEAPTRALIHPSAADDVSTKASAAVEETDPSAEVVRTLSDKLFAAADRNLDGRISFDDLKNALQLWIQR